MTTQPPDTKVQSETLEQTAERIVLEVAANPELVSYPDAGDRQLWSRAILSALRNERERAIRIINDHQALDKCEDNCWTTIKAAIREGR